MKKVLIILAVVALFDSCNSDQTLVNEKTAMLTSIAWKTGIGSDYSVDKFNSDGTYTMKFSRISLEVYGVWEWVSPTEISMQETELLMKGRILKIKTKPTNKTIIRIMSISPEKIVGLTHHILDAEDSGFAKEIAYTAE